MSYWPLLHQRNESFSADHGLIAGELLVLVWFDLCPLLSSLVAYMASDANYGWPPERNESLGLELAILGG